MRVWSIEERASVHGTVALLVEIGESCTSGMGADIFAGVWPSAAQLRKSGELLRLGESIKCPVVAIHGDYDPHPAAGVQKPLSGVLDDFRFILLEKCGHKPWIERNAKDAFYRILKEEIRSVSCTP